MAELHELLAVTQSLEGEAKKILDEAANTFTKRTAHFTGQTRKLTMFDADRKDEGCTEHKELDTTVGDKLSYVSKSLIKALDANFQRESTNQSIEARANVEINGNAIIKDVPATALLMLESWITRVRGVAETIPTLEPGIKWERDATQGNGIYASEIPEESLKSEKIVKPVTLYEATKEHPAQVEKVVSNINVGKYITTKLSGMISPAEKSQLLGRIDGLLRAIKKARSRANKANVVGGNVGKNITDYLFGDLTDK